MNRSHVSGEETTLDVPNRSDSAGVAPGTPAADLEQAAGPEAVPPAGGIPSRNLGWRIFKNSATQAAGRVFIALLRLLIFGAIVRSLGTGTFSEYSLILSILMIADWLVDFGTGDIFVREVSRQPQRTTRLLRVLTATKFLQIPTALVIVAAILLVLQYRTQIVLAGLVGATNVVFFAGVLVYRGIFRATLTMEREIAAEMVSVLIMLPLVLLVCAYGGGLIALVGCHTISRAVFCGGCFLLGRSRYRPSVRGVSWPDVRSSLVSSAPIGVIGFLVVGYEILDLVLLSKLAGLSDLAYFAGAQKLVWPLLVVLGSVGGSFYPVIASYWPHARDQFERACQRALESTMLVAGLAICTIIAGAEFFMGLLGPDLVAGALALKVLAVLCAVKAISTTLGPVLYVVNAQKKALKLVVIAVAVKTAVISALAWRFGYMGVVFGALAVEICFVAAPSLYLVQRLTGYRLRWGVPLKVAIITAAAVLASWLVLPTGGLLAAALAPAIYVPLALLSGAVRLSEVRSLLRWKTS